MKDASQGGSASGTGSSGAVNPPTEKDKGLPEKSSKANEIDFENEDFTIPPSFGQDLSEESLKDNEHPFVLLANLKIPLPENPGRVTDAMFDCLADFIEAVGKEDKKFIVFPHNLSNYKAVSDLPPRCDGS